jgi:hypothetical protein
VAAGKTGLTFPLPLRFLAAGLAVQLGRVLQDEVDYLKAGNRLLRERLGTKRIRLTDAERRRLATLGNRQVVADRDPLHTEGFRRSRSCAG